MNSLIFFTSIFLLILHLDFSATQELTGANGVVNLDDIQFLLFTRKNIDKEPAVLDPNVPGGLNEVIASLKIVIYVTGFSRKNESAADIHLRKAYLIREDVNFIHVDWHKLTKSLYSQTVNQSVHPVAKHVAGFIDRLVTEYSAKLDNIHMIGFGLGAQIAGISASYIPQGKVQQITGLDPHKFTFLDVDPSGKLDETDAKFVQIIHTSGRAISVESPIGHVDFYPNGGSSPQPLCSPVKQEFQFFMQPYLLLLCSHMMSIIYYIQSIYQPKLFVAQECENWAAANGQRCDGEATALMGYGADPNTRGIYYINISSFNSFIWAMRNGTADDANGKKKEDEPIDDEPYEDYKPAKHKKYDKYDQIEGKKYYYPKYEEEIDVAQQSNATDYNEDNLTEDDGDRITEVKKTLYTIQEYEEDQPNHLYEHEQHKEVAMKITQDESPEIRPLVRSGADKNIKFKSILILSGLIFIRFLF